MDTPSTKQKRVVLLIADDWSPLGGCYGKKFPETPRIDELAHRGTTFHRAYCASPSCGPSRACILTGLHSYSHGQYGNPHGPSSFRIDSRTRPITKDFRNGGIKTGIIGKRHLLPIEPFEFDFKSESEKVISRDRTLQDLDAFLKIAGSSDFFLMMAPFLPHRTTPDGFDHPNYAGLALRPYAPEEVEVPDFLPDLPEVREDLANYYSAITRFDEWVGVVMDEFQKKGIFEETLFLVLSDHGMPFLGAKATPFEGGQRCPLVVSCPGSELGSDRHTSHLVSWLDIAPTLAEWFGLPAAPEWSGRSFLSTLKDEKPEGPEEVYLSHMFHGLLEYYPYRIVCRQRWKYILRLDPELPLPVPADLLVSKSFQGILKHRPETFGKRRPSEVFYGTAETLYDLENDPSETTNLAGDPAFSDVLQDLRVAMQKHREETGDPLLAKKNQQLWQDVYPREK